MKMVLFICLFVVISGCSSDGNHPYKGDPLHAGILEKPEFNQAEFEEVCERIGKLNVSVVSPGSGLDPELMVKLKKIAELHNIDVHESCLKNTYDLGCSDTKKNRFLYFVNAAKGDCSILWAIRGGFGTEMLISDLNKLPIPPIKKTFIGFCDSTSMNIFVSQKWNWRAIHAPVLLYLVGEGFSKNKFDLLLDILENKIDSYDIKPVVPLNSSARSMDSVSGRLTGGNLTLVESSIGTCWEIQTPGKILFLEDAHEKPGSIYRSLYHLKDSGKLDGVRAIVLGTFLDSGDQNGVRYFLKRFAQSIDVPVYITTQFGHGYQNMPLIYNAMATLSRNKMTVRVRD